MNTIVLLVHINFYDRPVIFLCWFSFGCCYFLFVCLFWYGDAYIAKLCCLLIARPLHTVHTVPVVCSSWMWSVMFKVLLKKTVNFQDWKIAFFQSHHCMSLSQSLLTPLQNTYFLLSHTNERARATRVTTWYIVHTVHCESKLNHNSH